LIERSVYLNKLIKSKENGFPKVITGIRRCGKSYLLKEIYKKYLIETGVKESNILVLELDEEENSKYRDPIYLGDFVRNFCNNKSMCYVFLEEIQKVIPIVNPVLTNGEHIKAKDTDEDVISFDDVVLGLSDKPNIDLYVTGSNSKMLSTNIITEFRDKATHISIYPLSFDVYYNYVGGSTTDAMFEYRQHGGMHLAILKDEDDKEEYLKGLFETTYFKDILEHIKLYKRESVDELCNIISELTGSLLNSKKISDKFKSVKHEVIDKQTIDKYIEYFKDAFILREPRRYDLKGRDEIGALQKYYFTDTGLRNAILNFAFPDEGQMLENVVYFELIYNGYTVNVGTFETIEKNKDGKSVRKTNEVEFYATKNKKRLYIQVSKDISNENAVSKISTIS
jgi:predicted AAA+ superfamily ATPase